MKMNNVNTQLNYVQVGSEGTEELVGRVHEHHGQRIITLKGTRNHI